MEFKHTNKKQNKLLDVFIFTGPCHLEIKKLQLSLLLYILFRATLWSKDYLSVDSCYNGNMSFLLRQKAKGRVICRYTAKLKRFSRNTITKLEKKVKKIRKAYTPNSNENNTERKFRVFITAYIPKFRKYVKNTNLRLHINRIILFIGIFSKKCISTVKTNSVLF